MNFRYNVVLNALFLLILLSAITVFAADLPKRVVGQIYNSDGSNPSINDIQVDAYFQRADLSYTSPTHQKYNDGAGEFADTGFSWEIDVTVIWGWNNTGDPDPGLVTKARPTDVLYVSFLNVSGGTYDGETGATSVILDGADPQGADDVTLPVEITAFKAQFKDNVVQVSWRTQSEVDNLGFNVYRSTGDNSNYEQLNGSLISGAGTSTRSNEYSFADININSGNTYFYKLESTDINGTTHNHGEVFVVIFADNSIPESHQLYQNYPNPFNPTTTIHYSLAKDSYTKLSVFNIVGDQVAELVNENQKAGSYSVNWEGLKSNGDRVPTGIYFYKLDTNQATQVRKMIFAK